VTDKAKVETLNTATLGWAGGAVASAVNPSYRSLNCSEYDEESASGNNDDCGKPAFVIVHGAGSFGHHAAREYGLRGQTEPPPFSRGRGEDEEKEGKRRRRDMTGLAAARLSVQTLNRHVVSALIKAGINAVGMSPGLSTPGLEAHGGDEQGGASALVRAVEDALSAGLVPVLHGDACLYGPDGAGILGGDTLVEILATGLDGVKGAVFLTDVDGVYTSDPKVQNDAELLRVVEIDKSTGRVLTHVAAGGSTHAHDVTGGLETKLGSAAGVARSGSPVIIARCGSADAERALKGGIKDMERGTVVRLARL